MAVGGGFFTVISRCFSVFVNVDVESRHSWNFLGALDGQQLLVIEARVAQLVSEDVDKDTPC